MTCPSFSDRDAALRAEMMGPPTAQEHLRRAMRYSTDPRWIERQLSPPVEQPPRRWPEFVLPAGLIVGGVALAALLIVTAISVARAAERTAAFEIVAYPAGKDLRDDRPNLVVIAGPFGREECRIAIAAVKLANGSRLRCDRIEERRTR